MNDAIKVKKQSEKWTSISSANGFPVWVHSNFVAAKNNIGKITGSDVNARSEPKISNGSIIDQLNKGETLPVIQKNGAWYQLRAPSRFIAWVRTAELNALRSIEKSNAAISANSKPLKDSNKSAKSLNDADSNQWLFDQSPEGYTLQLATFSLKDSSTEFLEERNISGDPNLRAFASRQDDNNSTYYLYGSYLSKSEAKKAKKGLKLPKAWVRTFEELQQNRCVTWKTQLPTPQELKTYCVQ